MAVSTEFFAPGSRVATPVAGRHVAALDGIRGAAILMVLAHHLASSLKHEFRIDGTLLDVVSLGWAGVDLFFVLSGFLITGILHDSKGGGCYFRNFYMRRALRIFPLYFGALLTLALLRAAWPEAGLYGSANPLWMWAYLSNIVIAVQGFGAFGIADHFWSLAIEEQFYLAWPFAVYLLDRRRLMMLALAMCLGAPLLRAAALLLGAGEAFVYVLTPLRVDPLAAGAFVALAMRGPGGIEALAGPARRTAVLALAGLLLIVAGSEGERHGAPMQVLGHFLLAVLFAAGLVVALTSSLQRLLARPVMCWFGKYSYGLYVWHPMLWIIVFHSEPARALRGGSGPAELLLSVAVALAGTLALTLLSWHLLERPFLQLKRHFA